MLVKLGRIANTRHRFFWEVAVRYRTLESVLYSWLLYNGLVLNTTTAANWFGSNPRLQSLSNLTSMGFWVHFVPLVDNVNVLGVTFDSYLNLNTHICNSSSSSYFRIRAFRHILTFLDSETSNTRWKRHIFRKEMPVIIESTSKFVCACVFSMPLKCWAPVQPNMYEHSLIRLWFSTLDQFEQFVQTWLENSLVPTCLFI